MRYLILFSILSLAACTACCGSGGFLYTAVGMLTESKRWATTTGWLNIWATIDLVVGSGILATIGMANFNATAVDDDIPAE